MSNFSTLKQHAISAAITFGTTFLLTFAFSIQSPDFRLSKESIVALAIAAITAAVRALAKFVIEALTPVTT